ncbi:DUF2312 domain-containing protein [Roseococcus sp. SDR]|nr:DUF2312 domain-containing protein [Roseococcus sp. SDR]MBV1847494.1 DUF2312 domain-containing protein [Roseococcus sp. SDR]
MGAQGKGKPGGFREQVLQHLAAAAPDGCQVSIGGGPLRPVEEVREALQVVKGQALREKAAGQPQRDLEEATGVAPQQAEREAVAGGIAADRLRSIVDRIERLEQERKDLGGDIKDVFSEAKSAGFDVKVLRRLIRERKISPAELEQQDDLLALYRRALAGTETQETES